MDFTFSEEHQMLLDSADKIARDFPRDYYAECAKTKVFQKGQWAALTDAGFFGINTPAEYGDAHQVLVVARTSSGDTGWLQNSGEHS